MVADIPVIAAFNHWCGLYQQLLKIVPGRPITVVRFCTVQRAAAATHWWVLIANGPCF